MEIKNCKLISSCASELEVQEANLDQHRFRCWLPESQIMIGDSYVYFDDLSILEPLWLRRVIFANLDSVEEN